MEGEDGSREDRRAPERETQVYGCHRHRRSRHEICDLNRTTGETASEGSQSHGLGVEGCIPGFPRGAGGGSSRIEFLSPKSVTAMQTRRTSGLPTCRGGRGWRGSSECLAVRQTPVHLVGALFSTVIFYHISF